MRMARMHAMGAASDAAVAVTLAGSIFFSISPEDSRTRVVLYLLITMAPFAVVAPLIGPAIDRISGGRRMMMIATAFGRAVLALLLVGHIETLWLFPLAFGLLVLQKSYIVAKSAVVPALVRSDRDLVPANSRLALISAVSGTLGIVVAAGVSLLGGPESAAVVATVGFVATTVLAVRVVPVVVAAEPQPDAERAELREAPVLLAAYAAAILRGLVGFVTFLLAFEFRGGKDGLDVSTLGSAIGGATATARGIDITGDPAAPAWHFGVVLAGAALGGLVGARVAPMLCQRIAEERMMQTALVAISGTALFAVLASNLFGTFMLGFGVVWGATTGKLAFDSFVQRAAPDANHGRSFARFEARFQIAWVIGALVPAYLPLNIIVGGLGVMVVSLFALFSYSLGRPRRMMLKRRLWRPARGAAAGSDPVDYSEDGVYRDLTAEDIRPSQPLPPAGTAEWVSHWEEPVRGRLDKPLAGTAEWVSHWDQAVPIVSSVEGVEVADDPDERRGHRPNSSAL